MPSEYHHQHCPCRECRAPADRNRLSDAIGRIAVLVLLIGFWAVLIHGFVLLAGGEK